MIIVEGCDNTGKTTLVERLRDKFAPIECAHSPGPKTLGVQLAWIAKAIRRQDPRIIYDRYTAISERVYGPLLRPSQGDIFGLWTFDLLRLTFRRNPLIIYCRPPDERVLRWGNREQMDGVKDHGEDLLRRYDWIMEVLKELSSGQGMFLNYDYTRGEQAFNEVMSAVDIHLQSADLDIEKYHRRRNDNGQT